MNIVKSFEDHAFGEKIGASNWFWGLREDCVLCCTYDENGGEWHTLEDMGYWVATQLKTYLNLTIADMNKIVRQFGHLLIFT